MVAVRRSVDAVAARKHMVVVTGETGTGRKWSRAWCISAAGRAARSSPSIAAPSPRACSRAICSATCAARSPARCPISRASSARARRDAPLDEVAEIPMPLQANLLRVLEMSEVRPVGGTRDVATDVRVIATSNRELVDLVQGRALSLRPLLALAQWTIRLPPLRERTRGHPALTSHLLGRCDGQGRKLTPTSPRRSWCTIGR